MNGWAFNNDNGKAGSGKMVFGPTGQPLGAGSAELTLTQGIDGWALVTGNHEGTNIGGITSLDYSTYTGNSNAIALQLAVDNIGGDYYHRFVFEPGIQGSPVKANEWQRWNPTAATAKWWVTDSSNELTFCKQAWPCSWTDINKTYPNATITGGIWLKAGSGWSAGKYNVDAFHFIVAMPSRSVVYDFEPDRNNDSD
jgi:hypothetical protein